MMNNLDRFKKDLAALQAEAGRLELALLVKAHGIAEVKKALKTKIDAGTLEGLPNFNVAYEAWYSECLTLIKQLLPDRLQDFREHFEAPKNRKDLSFTTYRIQDALKGIQVTRLGEVIVDHRAAVPHFQQQAAILQAVQRRFETSLFDIRQLVQADLFDSELASARELAKKKFLRAAGAVAGVVLEKHLLQVIVSHSLTLTKKNPGIGDLNECLKSNAVIDVPQWRHISLLADLRNLCDHNKLKEPTAENIEDLLSGVEKVMKTVF